MKRVIRLLDDPVELTPRQLAQKKYWESAKGKAAHARYLAKMRLDPAWRAREAARAKAWKERNALRARVYKRIWQQTEARLKLAA
jgi:hypothetical protein